MKRMNCAIYYAQVLGGGAGAGVQLARCPAGGLRGLHPSQKHEGWDALADLYDDGGFSGGTHGAAGPATAAGRHQGRQGRRRGRLQGRPADPVARRLRQDRRGVRRARRLLRLGHPAVQHHDLHGPADAQRAAVLRPVRARGHRRAHPRQDRRLQGARACGWAAMSRSATTSRTASWSSTRPKPRRSA